MTMRRTTGVFTANSASLVLSAMTIAGLAGIVVGCSKGSQEAPPPSASAPAAIPSPTEKGVINMPPRAYSPGMNAADGIRALESEGYTVSINWGGGRQDQPLSMCRIGGVDGLRGSGAVTSGTNVYVTVVC